MAVEANCAPEEKITNVVPVVSDIATVEMIGNRQIPEEARRSAVAVVAPPLPAMYMGIVEFDSVTIST